MARWRHHDPCGGIRPGLRKPVPPANSFVTISRRSCGNCDSATVCCIRDEKPIRNWEDAEYYTRYLDHAIRWLETEVKFARPTHQRASIQAFEQGRAVFAARAREAFHAGK
jgi:hypothetical protein